jgi:hypothetical protein
VCLRHGQTRGMGKKLMFNIAPDENGRVDGEGDLAVETHFHPVGTP